MLCLHEARCNSNAPVHARICKTLHFRAHACKGSNLSVVNYSMWSYSETVYSDKANEFVMSRYHVTVIYTFLTT